MRTKPHAHVARLMAVLLAGCGQLDAGGGPGAGTRKSDEHEVRAEAIVNGTNASAWDNPATVAVYHGFQRPCSATLLRPTWVLTARHCIAVNPYVPNGPLLQPNQVRVAPPNVVTAMNGGINPGLYPPPSAVTALRFVDYDADTDLALIELGSRLAPPSPPACNLASDPYCVDASTPPRAMGLWNGETADMLNLLVRLMGYGRSNVNGNEADGSSGAGTLRMGNAAVTRTYTTFLEHSPVPGQPQVASGDSGGPSYALSDRFGRNLFGLAGWHITDGGLDGSPAGFRNWIRRTMSFPGSVTGNPRPDIMLVGGSGWNTFYWASSQGASGVFTANAPPPYSCSIICPLPPSSDPCQNLCTGYDLSGFASAAQQSNVRPVGGDFNGDKLLDVMLVGGSGTTMPLATSRGDGSFFPGTVTSQQFTTLARTPMARPVAGDFNGDGRTDIALTAGSGWPGIPVYWSNGAVTNATVTDGYTDFPGWSRSGAQTVSGDFDGDGRDDLALAGGPGWGSVPLALSNGDGTFLVRNEGVSWFPGWAQTANVKVVSGDFNGDGRDDLALTGGAGWGSIPVAFSAGDGTFWVTNEAVADFPGYAAQAGVKAVTGDFNGDGREDIALAGGTNWNTVPVAFSVGDGTFRVTNGGAGSFAVQARNANSTPFAIDSGGPRRNVHPATTIAAARNADGRLEVLYAGVDTLLYRNKELVPGGGWSGEIPFGGAAKKVALMQNQDGRLELFYIGTDDRLWHTWQVTPNGPWSGAHAQLAGTLVQAFTVGQNADGRLEVFYARAGDGEFFHNWQLVANGNWNGEVWLGGSGKRLAVERAPDGTLSLFCIGTDDAIWQAQQQPSGGWMGWWPLGGNAKELVVGRNQDGRLRLFYIAGNNAPTAANTVRTNYQLPGGGWSGDLSFGNTSQRFFNLALARTADERLELFLTSPNGTGPVEYYQPTQNADFGAQIDLSGFVKTKAFAAAAPTAGWPLEMFYLSHENVIHRDAPGASPGTHSTDRLIGDTLGIREARLCVTIGEYDPQPQTFTCPAGQVIEAVTFASYGTPTGTCPAGALDSFFSYGSCHSPVSLAKVEAACLGKQSCALSANNDVFGEYCAGTVKRLYAFMRCI